MELYQYYINAKDTQSPSINATINAGWLSFNEEIIGGAAKDNVWIFNEEFFSNNGV